MRVGSGSGVKSVPSTTPTLGHFVLFPVSLVSKDQDGSPSNSTIDTYDLTEKQGTVNSLIGARRTNHDREFCYSYDYSCNRKRKNL